jgi:hypothetical protein
MDPEFGRLNSARKGVNPFSPAFGGGDQDASVRILRVTLELLLRQHKKILKVLFFYHGWLE